MILRPYDAKKDKEAVVQVWQDSGWIDPEFALGVAEMDHWFAAGRTYVAELDGRPECMVTIHDGTLRHGRTEIPLAGVTGVATSFLARKEGLAAALTSHAVAQNAHLPVAGLGFFEQGFYDRFGFGCGPYEHEFRFDPANLELPVKARRPVRITADDWEAVHESRLNTPRLHGAQTMSSPGWTRFRMKMCRKGFGLGYRGAGGRITHHFWAREREGHAGPLNVQWISYQTTEQFLEVMALFKRMSDQIRTVAMREPPGMQLQDLLRHPVRDRVSREDSRHDVGVSAHAHWQIRINDVEACLAATSLRCAPLPFNLKLTDPIADYLGRRKWRGCGGTYIVTVAAHSKAARGSRKSLPTLEASVNAFSRLWLGVLPATTLSATDELSGPPKLLAALDEAFTLPLPRTAWSY